MKSIIIAYMLVCSDVKDHWREALPSLNIQVNQAIKEGWQPLGALTNSNTYYLCQPMVKYKKEECR